MKLKNSIRIIENERPDAESAPRDRNLLYILPEGKALATKLGLAGWNVIEVIDLDTADELFETTDFLVCLVHLTPFNWNEVLQFVKRLQARRMAARWVAMVSRHAVAVPAIAALIEEYFYDYHTLPADVPRLLVTLGRAQGMAGLPYGRSHRENRDLKEFGLLGDSPVMHSRKATIKMAVERIRWLTRLADWSLVTYHP